MAEVVSERDLVRLLVQGLGIEEMATELKLPARQVLELVSKVLRELAAQSRA